MFDRRLGDIVSKTVWFCKRWKTNPAPFQLLKGFLEEFDRDETMARMTTIIIVDEHPLYREGVKSVFKEKKDFDVIGEAVDTTDAIRKICDLKPDIVLVDLSLASGKRFRLVKEMKETEPDMVVIVLAINTELNHIVEAFKAGASGFVVKKSPLDILMQSIISAIGGRYFLDPAVSGVIMEELIRKSENREKSILTDREREIAKLLAEGFKPKQIAEKLNISRKTAENHRYNILKKLNLHSTNDLVKYAVKSGLTDVESWN